MKRVTQVEDSVLGKLLLSEDEDWWEGHVKIGEKRVGFKLGGHTEPSRELLAHAHDIIWAFDDFERMVAAFLLAETERLKLFAEEIRKLVIDEICLFWPDRPNDGMIYFVGSNEFRLWRCDYLNRKPTKLGFDT